jgi:hypothetical protein
MEASVKFKGDIRNLGIYVPVGGRAFTHIVQSSAIVGEPSTAFPAQDGDLETPGVLCFFESGGNAVNLRRFAEKLHSAAGRGVTGYPTVACGVFRATDLKLVGAYDGERYVVTSVTNPEALREWSGEGVEHIMGHRLPTGKVPLSLMRDVKGDDLRPVGHGRGQDGLWFKTRAGQIVLFPVAATDSAAIVYDHDDPELRERLLPVVAREEDLVFITGRPAEATGPAPR